MNQKIKVLHVDDYEGDLIHLKHVVNGIPELHYVQGFKNADDCLAFINENEDYYLIFIDIDMPGNDGLWLAKHLNNERFSIVFLTNHTDYAREAFRVCALDYLIKPIDEETLADTLQQLGLKKKMMGNLVLEQLGDFYEMTQQKTVPKRIFITTVDSIQIVILQDLAYIMAKANGSYCEFVLSDDRRLITTKSIRNYELMLNDHPDFVRIHKSYLINKEHLASISKKRLSHKAIMKNGEQLEMSYQRREAIMESIMK